ncbi:MAG: cytochrome c oxidase assembly protein, partial [Betaproteobacteria bacterium]
MANRAHADSRSRQGSLEQRCKAALLKLCVFCILAPVAAAWSSASAHTLDESPPTAWALQWTFEPWVMVCLALSATLYGVGLMRLWSHTGSGRGVRPLQALAFALGWWVLVIALVSQLDELGGQLFSGHMVQHELLMIVAAPLLVLGRPLAAWAWALPLSWRRGSGAFFHAPAWRMPWLVITGPLSAWVLHAVALWGWHVPVLFEAALANDGLHALQHITFLLTALLFWWSIFGAVTRKQQSIALIS